MSDLHVVGRTTAFITLSIFNEDLQISALDKKLINIWVRDPFFSID